MTDSTDHRHEERIAHLERDLSDLSEQVARQQAEIGTLTRRLGLLLDREAERESEGGGGVLLADRPPPHY
ncbi:SlyX family protein [Histidinibacterium lentulum]|uniref:SlyX family protein n=1 Tax=Histidinibacterium lentulum TaxID=2480588 RepID=A0A3N2R4P2_9RHOB|nr:SlyX family protein [Histidinibacterium lentulum]ROU02460.1 SlyX family protein [Histidinibacterium lentulum]